MKKDDKYRFGLGFKADTQERIQVGDFLNSLGNKKSDTIVRAVAEFMVNHPEEVKNPTAIKVLVQPRITREDIKEILSQLLEDHGHELHSIPLQPSNTSITQNEEAEDNAAVDAMLDNLDLFN